MPELEVTRTVLCPNTGEMANIEEDCEECDFFDGESRPFADSPIICNFGEDAPEEVGTD